MPTDLPTDQPDEATQSPSPRLSDILTLRDMAIYIADTAITRGRNYQAQGRVRNLVVSPDLTSITATVHGSRPEPYRQNINFSPAPAGRTKINGQCTCPMGYNCKHVAAALFEALANHADAVVPLPQPQPTDMDPPNPAAAPSDPILPIEVMNWLQQLTLSASGDDYPLDINQRLLYLLTPYTAPNSVPHLAVDLALARLLKNGDFSDSITRQTLNNFYLGNSPRYFRSSDIEICQALLSSSRNGTGHTPYQVKSESLWKSIVATGRAYWQNHNSPPLTLGEPRPGQIEWVMPDSRGMRPVVKVEGAIALNSEPPVYIDAQASLIGEIGLSLPPHLAHRLLNAPAISPAYIAKVGQTLSRFLPDHAELIPKPPAPPTLVDAPPVPVIRLMLATETINAYYRVPPTDMPVAHLSFRYGPVDVALGETRPLIETINGNRRYLAKRSPSQEKDFLSRLFDLDLRFAREIHSLIGPSHHQDLAFPDPFYWLSFLSRDVPSLQAQGFEVIIDSDFPYRLAKPSGDIETDFTEGQGIDWFELGLGVQVDGQKLDLAPMLANLVLTDGLDPEAVRTLARDGDDIYIPLDDGRHLALAAKRFLPVIIALHDLTMGGSAVGKNGRLQVSKAESALLSILEEQEGIVFRGADNLRRMARSLNVASTGGIAPVTLPNTFQATLRPYQEQGVAWLNLLRDVGLGGILADDMGLGKTVQILALLSLEKAQGRLDKPALIIAPTSLMTNWQSEARKFAPNLSLLLLHGAARRERFEEITSHDIVLTTYPLIARDQAVLLEQHWHMAILDEAQTIKNPNAATTRLIRDLKASHRFCLTGTPMENHLGELWSLMSFVNPGYLGDKSSFGRRWRTPIEKYADSDRSQLLARRVKPFMLRRTKQEVAGELPPKTEITESIILEDKQRDVYDSIRLSMHKKVRQAIAAKGLAKSHIIILEALLKLRQVCCDPRLLKLASDHPPPSAKLERLMEMVDELLAEGRKIIVFSQFTSMLALITERFAQANIAYSLLTGETKDRKTAIETFQNGLVSVFLISLKAGGVGLNLTAADTVILYDPWWNPAVEEQAIDRAYRIGQDKPVFVYRLVASQTIEEKMDDLKAKKRALADSLFDQAGNPATTLTEDDLNNLFDA